MSFITTVLIFSAVIVFGKVFPFGDRCILRTDMYHQYAPFFSELREKLQTGGSLKFTWDLGLGVNFIAIMAYYLASPVNFLVGLVDKNYVIEFMTVLIIVKTGACASSMAYYLHAGSERSGFGAYIFSLFYGLSGYICAYYWNLMWLDSVAVFPLIVLGAERLIRGKSGLLYTACLGFSIFTNYYISILICIFLVLYFFVRCILDTPQSAGGFVKICIRFALCSILAAGIAAVMLLPEIYAFRATASSSNELPQVFTDYFSLLRESARHLPLVETEQGLDHWPNIYCGTAAILLFFLYIFNRRISLKEKVAYITLALFFLASFAINILNFIWHGLHYPNSLPARQSFIYIFLIIYMGFRVYENIDIVSKKDIGKAFGLSFAYILIMQELVEDDAFGFGVFYLALLLTALYAGLLHIYRRGAITGSFAMTLLFLLAVIELTANTAYTSITTTSRKAFTADNEEIRELAGIAKEDADGFYRIERDQRKSKDDGAWLNFPSASIFSSMANADGSKFFRQLGMEASTNAYSITGSTPLADMLFGISYRLSTDGENKTDGLSIIAESGDTFLYKNEYTLGLGFAMPQRMASEWMTELDDPALVQNSLSDVLMTEQILISVFSGGSSIDGECALTLDHDGLYFAYEDNFRAGDITVSWPDKKKTFTNLDRSFFMELGYCSRGELINFAAENAGEDPEISVYRLNERALRQMYEKLSEQQLEVTEYGDDFVKGTVTVDTAGLGYSSDRAEMLITTPYDRGWKVKVDGTEVATYKGLDTFISFYISSGTHEIEMSYEPEGVKAGAAISFISIALLIAMAAAECVLKKKHEGAAADTDVSEAGMDDAMNVKQQGGDKQQMPDDHS